MNLEGLGSLISGQRGQDRAQRSPGRRVQTARARHCPIAELAGPPESCTGTRNTSTLEQTPPHPSTPPVYLRNRQDMGTSVKQALKHPQNRRSPSGHSAENGRAGLLSPLTELASLSPSMPRRHTVLEPGDKQLPD